MIEFFTGRNAITVQEIEKKARLYGNVQDTRKNLRVIDAVLILDIRNSSMYSILTEILKTADSLT
jgi:hypothetical protein